MTQFNHIFPELDMESATKQAVEALRMYADVQKQQREIDAAKSDALRMMRWLLRHACISQA